MPCNQPCVACEIRKRMLLAQVDCAYQAILKRVTAEVIPKLKEVLTESTQRSKR